LHNTLFLDLTLSLFHSRAFLDQRKNMRGKFDKIKSLSVMETNGYRFLLPEGTLDYFIISDIKESSTDIVIFLEEKRPN